MTDTTDIKALREAALKATPGPWVTVDYFWIAQEKDGHGGEFIVFDNGPDAAYVRNLSPDRILALLDQLEAERQRADDAHKYGSERDAENESLMLTIGRLRVEIAALKGDQVPVAWTSQRSLETKNKIVAFTDDMSALDYGTANGWTDIVELFTAPQKPVVLPCEVKELISHIDDVLDNDSFERIDPKKWNAVTSLIAIGEIEAAGGIVKDGERDGITCWSCKKSMTLAQHSSNDGLCPHCNVEIDLEE